MTTSPNERAWYRLKITEARIQRRHIVYIPAEAAAIRRAGLWDDAVCIETTPMAIKALVPA